MTWHLVHWIVTNFRSSGGDSVSWHEKFRRSWIAVHARARAVRQGRARELCIMIRSVLSLATLQRQPNNVTCCTSPPDLHTNPGGFSLSLRLARNYRLSGTGKSRLKDTTPSYEFHLSRAPAMNARTHKPCVEFATSCVSTRTYYTQATLANLHSRTADRDVEHLHRRTSVLYARSLILCFPTFHALWMRFTIFLDLISTSICLWISHRSPASL